MKLSIIIPVYNQEKLIIKALDSIPKRKDIEIIIINDGSTDNTLEVVKDYQKKHNELNIKIFYNEKNKGVGYTVNRGYDNATGEYIILLGSDDYLLTDKINYMIDNELDGTDLIYFNLEVNNGDIWRLMPKNKTGYCGSVKFMRREFIGNTRCPNIRSGEDYHFYQELLNKNPTEKFTDIVVKHYNFPRENSLFDLMVKGKI